MIKVNNLTKSFSFNLKSEKKNFIQNFLNPEKKIVTAVKNISFEIEKGESVGFIGPNGAGKSTTIKMLTGILFPTSGKIKVAGIDPQNERKKLAYKIGTVFGQRSQLIFNLPVKDSFELFGAIFDMKDSVVKKRAAELSEIFELKDFFDQPVRKLSLGQRMRAEIAVALLHKPSIIFLDEPTIGLDVMAKNSLRKTLINLNKEEKTTIFLTSHDAGDIESISDRTMFINKGEIVLDNTTEYIRKNILKFKRIKVINSKPVSYKEAEKVSDARILSQNNNEIHYEVDTSKISLNKVITEIVQTFDIIDMDVENPSLEEVIQSIYQDQK